MWASRATTSGLVACRYPASARTEAWLRPRSASAARAGSNGRANLVQIRSAAEDTGRTVDRAALELIGSLQPLRARPLRSRAPSSRELDPEDLLDGAAGLGALLLVEDRGHPFVELRGALVVDALELRQEVGVEDLVEQAGLRRRGGGALGRVASGVDEHRGTELLQVA